MRPNFPPAVNHRTLQTANPGQSRWSIVSSFVTSVASRIMAEAAIIASGSFRRGEPKRRMRIASFLIESLDGTNIIFDKKLRRSISASCVSAGDENNSISVITLKKRSPLGNDTVFFSTKSIITLVSRTKELLIRHFKRNPPISWNLNGLRIHHAENIARNRGVS